MKIKICLNCSKKFDTNKSFYAHIRKCGKPQGKYKCPYCTVSNARKDDLIQRHIVDRHPERMTEVKQSDSLIQFVRTETLSKQPMSKSDDEFVQKLDKRLGLYVGGDFEERQELDEMVSAPKHPRMKSPAEAEAAPAVTQTPPYESTHSETQIAVSNLLKTMDTTTSVMQQLATVLSSTSTTSCTVVNTVASGLAPVSSVIPFSSAPAPLSSLISPSPPAPTSVPAATSRYATFSPSNPLSLDLPKETPYVPKTLDEMKLEELCRNVARDTVQLYERTILKSGDPAQREERCPHGYLLPVHIHRYKKITSRDGTVTIIREILVNCTECPAPTIMEVMAPSRCKCFPGH